MANFFEDLTESFKSIDLEAMAKAAGKSALGGLLRGAREGMIDSIIGNMGEDISSLRDDYLPNEAEILSDLSSKGFNFSGAVTDKREIPNGSDVAKNSVVSRDPFGETELRKQIQTESSREIMEVISTDIKESEFVFTFPNWTYADWINERAMWQRGITSVAGEPGWFYFKVFFDFNTQQGLFGGLLNDEKIYSAVNSAGKFLRSGRKYYKFENVQQRLVALKKFASMLSYIETNAPWFFKSIKGLDKIPEPTKDFTKERFIELVCSNESVDIRLTTLLDLYRFAAFDDMLNKEVIPENLRKFDMNIVVFNTPIKKFHTSFKSSSLKGKFNYKSIFNLDSGGNNSDYSNIMSYKMYTFKNCEIDLETYANSQPADMNNESAFQFAPSIKIKYDRLYTHTSNEFIGMMFGVDGIYYNQYHNTKLNLGGDSDPYLINTISGMTVQEKRYKAMRNALTNFYFNPSSADAYQELIDASEIISNQILHLPISETQSLAKSVLLGLLKSNYNNRSKLGNLFGDTAPGSAYFADKILKVKYGNEYQSGFFSHNKPVKKIDLKGSIMRTIKAINFDNYIQPEIENKTKFYEESALSKLVGVTEQPHMHKNGELHNAKEKSTVRFKEPKGNTTKPYTYETRKDYEDVAKELIKGDNNTNFTQKPYSRVVYNEINGVKQVDAEKTQKFAEMIAEDLLKTKKSSLSNVTGPYMPTGIKENKDESESNLQLEFNGMPLKQNIVQSPYMTNNNERGLSNAIWSKVKDEFNEDNKFDAKPIVTSTPHIPSGEMEVKDDTGFVTQTPYTPNMNAKNLSNFISDKLTDIIKDTASNKTSVTENPHIPDGMKEVKDDTGVVTQVPYVPNSNAKGLSNFISNELSSIIQDTAGGNSSFTQSPYTPDGKMEVKDDKGDMTQTPYTPNGNAKGLSNFISNELSSIIKDTAGVNSTFTTAPHVPDGKMEVKDDKGNITQSPYTPDGKMEVKDDKGDITQTPYAPNGNAKGLSNFISNELSSIIKDTAGVNSTFTVAPHVPDGKMKVKDDKGNITQSPYAPDGMKEVTENKDQIITTKPYMPSGNAKGLSNFISEELSSIIEDTAGVNSSQYTLPPYLPDGIRQVKEEDYTVPIQPYFPNNNAKGLSNFIGNGLSNIIEDTAGGNSTFISSPYQPDGMKEIKDYKGNMTQSPYAPDGMKEVKDDKGDITQSPYQPDGMKEVKNDNVGITQTPYQP